MVGPLSLLYCEKCIADECSAPQVCNAVGQSSGTCVTPKRAGASCDKSASPPGTTIIITIIRIIIKIIIMVVVIIIVIIIIIIKTISSS